MPAVAAIKCPNCRHPLPWPIGQAAGRECPRCSVQLDVEIFPAVGAPPPTAVVPGVDGTATCYFHDGTAADHVCGQCGRFTCDLCILRVGPHGLCPQCLARQQHNLEVLPTGDTRVYEKIAFNVFLTKDELIHVENNITGKRYIHVHFTDIHAIIMQRSPAVLRLFGVSCSLHLQNAVQTLRLPVIHTQRQAKAIVAKLRPKIEAHQGAPPPTPAPTAVIAPVTPYFRRCRTGVNFAFHVVLLLFGAVMAARFAAPLAGIWHAAVALFGASVLLTIGALIRQCRSNLPAVLKALPWIHLLVAAVILKFSRAGSVATELFWRTLLPLLLGESGSVPIPTRPLSLLQEALAAPPTTSSLHRAVSVAGALYGIGIGIAGIVLLTVYSRQNRGVADE